jgi:hypothetical protein
LMFDDIQNIKNSLFEDKKVVYKRIL